MRATSIGHAGILIDTVDGSIACDPWFLPQFFGSWFVFPRNDQLPADLMHRICNPTYLYVSHIHADHLDEDWLLANMNKDTTVLVPGFPTRELERILFDMFAGKMATMKEKGVKNIKLGVTKDGKVDIAAVRKKEAA